MQNSHAPIGDLYSYQQLELQRFQASCSCEVLKSIQMWQKLILSLEQATFYVQD